MVAIVIKSIVLTVLGVLPPANIPLVGDPQLPLLDVVAVKLPKSTAFPVDAVVTYCITS